MTALSSYSTGTISVATDGTAVTGASTLWLSAGNAKPGDLLQSGHFCVFITDVTDDAHLTITPWPGAALSGATYAIWKVSQQRIAGAAAAADVDKMVGALNTSGFFVFVGSGAAAPDPSLGDDGQYAFQPTTGKTWAKVAGVWSYLGLYKGFNLTGAYNGATIYSYGDVQTTSGSSYIYINATPSAGHAAPDATYWQLLASKGDPGTNGATPLLPVAPWATATNYVAGPPASYVTNGGSSYMCLVPHTSGTFATDLAAGKWGLVGQKGGDGSNGAGYGGTSTTSRTIGLGSLVFTTQAGLAYTSGARVRATATAGATGWVEGVATYSGTTLTITSDKTNGSGTGTAWNLNLAGEPGLDGTATLANVDRQNILLDRIYLSKSLAGYRRAINAVADGFKASDGIDAGNSSGYTLSTSSGNVAAAGYTAQAPSSVNTSFTYTTGTAQANLYDGNDSTPAADPAGINASMQAAYDLGSAKDITRVRIITAPSSGFTNTVTFNIQYSDTSLTAGFTTVTTIVVPAGTSQLVTQTFASVGAHRYWRIVYVSGTSGGNAWLGELSFMVFNNMTLVTTAQTADASVSNGRVLIEFDNTASPVLNTDLTVEVTCNGGTNWTTATLSQVSTRGQGGRYVAETADTPCTAGTSFAARIKSLNGKSVPIYGVSLTVH